MVFFLVVFGAWEVTAQTAQDTTDDKIRQILDYSGSKAAFMTAIDQMIGMQRQNPANDEIPADFWNEFSAEIHQEGYEELLPDLIEIYRNNYSEAEIDHMLAYFSDPMSRQIASKQTAVMQQSMTAGGEWGQALAMKIVERLQAVDKN